METKSLRRVHPPAFKARVALEAIKEQKTISQLSSQYEVHPTQITKWKHKALVGLEGLFSDNAIKLKEKDDGLIRSLYEQVGQLKVENDWLKKGLALLKIKYNLKVSDLILHINKSDNLSITRQAELLGIARSDYYYQPVKIDPENLSVMNKIDEIYTKRPYYGLRRMAKEAARLLGYPINRKRVQKLMRDMGIEAIYPKPNLSRNTEDHPVFPYLLRGVPITHPNHVWGTDITYIRMEKGFLYLTAFMDWYSRFVLS